MRLRVEKGAGAGTVIELESALLTIGRSPDNDVVIADEMVSQHHAKIWRDVDGRICITDMDSVNGTEVNGRTVQTVELRPGDRIVVGKTVMRVLGEPAPATTASSRTSFGTSIDLGFERRGDVERAEGRRQPKAGPAWLTKRVVVVTVCAALAVLAAYVVKKMLPESGPRVVSVKTPQEPLREEMEVYYEYVEGATTGQQPNVQRYEISLKGSQLSVAFDDLKEESKIYRQKKLNADELARILAALNVEEVRKLQPEYLGRSQPDTFSQLDLRVTHGPDHFRVLVRNMMPPEPLLTAKKNLMAVVEDVLGITFINKEDRLRAAKEAFEKAERERYLFPLQLSSLATAVKFYKQAEEYLSVLEPKPPLYEKARDMRIETDARLTAEVEGRRGRAQIRKNVGDWVGAAKELEEILKMFTDTNDPRYKLAYEELVVVRQRLRP